MISSINDWLAAGAAIVAVSGGLLGVYSTTQSSIEVTDSKVADMTVLLHRLTEKHFELADDTTKLRAKVDSSELGAEQLKKVQEELSRDIKLLIEEVRSLRLEGQ